MTQAPASSGGHGWWPYILPYMGFLLAVEISARMPESLAGVMLFVKPAVPLGLLIWFWSRGAYPELRSGRPSLAGTSQDVVVGIGLALLWMAPYVYIAAIRPEVSDPFDAGILGDGREAIALGVKLFGYAVVTPIFEELFIRSFVMRAAEVYMERGDFRKVPLAQYSVRSFVTTVIVFTIGHVPWEWWVAVPWVVLTNLWFYYRKDLLALVVVHGVTNASILVIALYADGLFTGPDGQPLSLWFFL